MAFRVGESKVEARLDGTVLINGEASPNLPAMQGNLPGGGAVGVWREGTKLKYVVVLWPDVADCEPRTYCGECE